MKHIASTCIPVALCGLLAACGGPHIRTMQAVALPSHKTGYELTGVTSVEETSIETTIPYIEKGIALYCPNGGRIVKKSAEPTHNGFGQQALYWHATIECKD